jgi:acetylornithine deacetylase
MELIRPRKANTNRQPYSNLVKTRQTREIFPQPAATPAVNSSAILSFPTVYPALPSGKTMDVFELTRTLIDIESITPNEAEIGQFLYQYLSALTQRFGGEIERLPVEEGRDNIFVHFGVPIVTLSTHMDTVPPFIASRDDGEQIWGRGACDTKGIIASMITAAGRLLENGKRNFGLLFVVGEERNSAGALAAAKTPRGSKYIVNGEPTENRLALGSKGALRFEIVARGRMAHSAYPELGESAIEKLLNALERIRKMPLPVDPTLGPSTLNIGTIQGGRAPNVIPDQASAEIFIRVVGDVTDTRSQIKNVAAPDAEANEVLFIPSVRLGSLPGFDTTVVAYTTDIPAFGQTWGEPFLLGPGTIHVAHTSDERIAKSELAGAVEIYSRLVERLSQQ